MCIILSACLCACAHELPPDSGTPWPQNHFGVFTSEYGTLTFNGDGESIVFNLTAELAEATGLPEGETKGTYVFLFHHGAWRYDKAESFRISASDDEYGFKNDFTQTNEDTIAVFSPISGSCTVILFKKGA